jgi:hypothetical protein
MFEVLYKPFPDALIETNFTMDRSTYVILIWKSTKGYRILMEGQSLVEEKREHQYKDFETAATLLNQSPSITQTKIWLRSLRSVVSTWQESERGRARQERTNRTPFFRADFGRMDMGGPGQGGSGVDGYW